MLNVYDLLSVFISSNFVYSCNPNASVLERLLS